MVVDVARVERTALRFGARCSGSMFICQAALSPCAASASTLSTACCRRVIQIDHAPIMLGAHVGSVLVSDTAHARPCRVELRRGAVPLSSPRGSDPGDTRRAGRGASGSNRRARAKTPPLARTRTRSKHRRRRSSCRRTKQRHSQPWPAGRRAELSAPHHQNREVDQGCPGRSRGSSVAKATLPRCGACSIARRSVAMVLPIWIRRAAPWLRSMVVPLSPRSDPLANRRSSTNRAPSSGGPRPTPATSTEHGRWCPARRVTSPSARRLRLGDWSIPVERWR